jgi:hypothetical protein
MAQEFSTTAKNAMLDAITVNLVSLHNDDPGASGTSNELTGGSPAYAREAITFAAASGGARDSSTQPEFDIPAGSTVAWVGFWNSTGPVFMGRKQLASSEAFTGQGTYTLTDADLLLNDPA